MSHGQVAQSYESPDSNRWPGSAQHLGGLSPASSRPTPNDRKGLVPLVLLVTTLHGLGGVSMVPVLSTVRQQFAGNPRVDMLLPATMAVYALSIAVFAPVFGCILDFRARRKLLVAGLLAYGLFGTAPLWTVSLEQLVVSRILLGVAAAAVFTSALVLLCDVRQGQRYARVVGGMALLDNLAAAGFLALAGYLGQRDWRASSWPYVLAPVLAVSLMVVLLRSPPEGAPDLPFPASARRGRPVHWRLIFTAVMVVLFVTIIFYTPTAASALVLARSDLTAPSTVGVVSAATILATAVGSVIFLGATRVRPAIPLATALAIAAVGFVIVTSSGTFVGTVAGVIAVVGLTTASVGCGLLLPAVTWWFTSGLAYHERGRGIGLNFSGFYLGVFAGPVAAQIAVPRSGGVTVFFGAMAGLSFVLALGMGAAAWRETHSDRRRTSGPGSHRASLGV